MGTGKVLFLALMVLIVGVYSAGAATITVTTTIQAAIDIAVNGDVVKIPAGTYSEAIVIDGKDNLTITGAGQGITIIDGTGMSEDLVTISNSTKITFQNCTVASADNGYKNVFLQHDSNVTLTSCTVENGTSDGIYAEYSSRIAIKNCLLQNNSGWGVSIGTSSNSLIVSSIVDTNGQGIGILSGAHNTLVSKNTVSNNVAEGIFDIGNNTLVRNNTVTGSVHNGIVYTGFSPFGSIYSKNIISGNGEYGAYATGGFPVFVGNVMDGNGTRGFYADDQTYCTLIRNVISNNGLYGIYLYNSSGYLYRNTVTGSGSWGVYQSTTTSTFIISKILTMTGNRIIANGDAGVVFNDTSSNAALLDARKNYIVGNDGNGITVFSGKEAFFEKNTVGINNGTGISSAIPGSFYKNYIYANMTNGISSDIHSVINKNRVYANNGSGIKVTATTYLEKNIVLSNDLHGIDTSAGANNFVENNKVLGNGDGINWFDLYDPGTDDFWFNNKYTSASL